MENFWHRDVIIRVSEKKFIAEYCKWAKKKEYRSSETKAKSLYTNALEGIPTLPSNSPSAKMLALEAVKAVRETETTLTVILARMTELAKKLPEYDTVRAMPGVGDVMAPRLIAEIGDVRAFIMPSHWWHMLELTHHRTSQEILTVRIGIFPNEVPLHYVKPVMKS